MVEEDHEEEAEDSSVTVTRLSELTAKHAATEATGWILTPTDAWIFLAIWVAVVLVHGFYRSVGEAKQDPIRPSGPTD